MVEIDPKINQKRLNSRLRSIKESKIILAVIDLSMYGTAKSNYIAYLQAKEVKYKKYFYVIRPLLACIWIEQNHSPAPVLFNDLKKEILKLDILDEVEKLIKVKMKMNESDKGPKIDIINSFIENELIRIDKKLKDMKSDIKPEWFEINSVFMRLLNHY